uniref:Uncharacterized protein n=1 Tax=Cacopsylla melanoneura TaxID=428564 RepID=A0A8D8URW1_9HEMI
MELSDEDFDDISSNGDDSLTSKAPPASPSPAVKDMSSPPMVPENDFYPKYSVTRSSSLPSIPDDANKTDPNNSVVEKEEFPLLPSQDSRKRIANSPPPRSNRTDKIKKQNVAPPKDLEITDGFKFMVHKIVETNEQLSVSTDQICELIARLKNSQKRQEIVRESKLPVSEVLFVLQEIHANPDTTANMKSRITRLLSTDAFTEPKMTLVNVPSV